MCPSAGKPAFVADNGYGRDVVGFFDFVSIAGIAGTVVAAFAVMVCHIVFPFLLNREAV